MLREGNGEAVVLEKDVCALTGVDVEIQRFFSGTVRRLSRLLMFKRFWCKLSQNE